MSVPKLIHQTVKDKSNLDITYRDNIRTLQERNPGWEHTLYDDDDIVCFIQNYYDAETLQRYKKINPVYGAAKADYFRYLLMLKIGGVYLDIKSTCHKKLDDVILDNDVFILSRWHNNKKGERYEGHGIFPELSPLGEYQQWHIIAAPNHPFLREVVSDVSKNIDNYAPFTHGVGFLGVMRTTGPIAYTLAIQKIERTADYRLVDIESIGFDYSIFSTPKNTQVHITPIHYTYQRLPVIAKGFFDPLGNPIELTKLRRNSLCPCSSGGRLKHCHGVL